MPQFIAGGGLTPVVGLRFGAGFAHGAYKTAADSDVNAGVPPASRADVTVFNFESEYAFGHTRLSGEWVRSRFESTLGPAVARGYFVQAVHAFTPRLFGTVRLVGASAPAYVRGAVERRSMATAELTAGYRLTHDVTVRGGYYASRRYGSTDRRHNAIVSLVWARRWF
jgi:hypothetical protein